MINNSLLAESLPLNLLLQDLLNPEDQIDYFLRSTEDQDCSIRKLRLNFEADLRHLLRLKDFIELPAQSSQDIYTAKDHQGCLSIYPFLQTRSSKVLATKFGY